MKRCKLAIATSARRGLARLGITAVSSAMAACTASSTTIPRSTVTASPLTNRAAQPQSARKRLATWVWTSETLLLLEQRHALLAFAQAKRINALYLQYSPKYEEATGFEALLDFLRQTRTLDIEVTFVAGDPRWALTEHHATALGLIENTRRLNQRLAAAGAPTVRGVQYDVEPYLLADWKARPATVEPQYAALLAKLHEAARREHLELWLTMPFWFEHHQFESTTLDRLALKYADGVVVMAYRDTTARVTGAAASVLNHAQATGRPVVVAIETSCRQPPEVTFCSASQREFEGVLTEIQGSLERYPEYCGLAVHQYAYWRELRHDSDPGMHTSAGSRAVNLINDNQHRAPGIDGLESREGASEFRAHGPPLAVPCAVATRRETGS